MHKAGRIVEREQGAMSDKSIALRAKSDAGCDREAASPKGRGGEGTRTLLLVGRINRAMLPPRVSSARSGARDFMRRTPEPGR